MADETHALPHSQPGFSSVFQLSYVACAPQHFFIDLELTAICRQGVRKFLGEVNLRNKALNAPLLQQTAASAALRRAGNLPAIHHYVGANRIREAVVAGGGEAGCFWKRDPAGVNAPGYNCAFTGFI
jgi:hypothetical protein